MLYDIMPTIVKLTKAQYDALDPADQANDTIYFITDVNGTGDKFQPVIYSEEEREIGVWTDGKPLYEKTCIFNPVALSNGTTIAHGISNVDAIVWVDSFMTRSNNRTVTFPYGSGYDKFSGFYADRTNLTFTGGDTWQLVDYSQLYTTIRYTKTTDTPGSGTWTPQGVPAVHYSTDEQVVGTWTDGSTLYQKTYSYSISSETSQEIATLDSNIIVKEIKGIIHNNGIDMNIPWIDASFFYNVYITSTHKLTAIKKNTGDWTSQPVEITLLYTKSST